MTPRLQGGRPGPDDEPESGFERLADAAEYARTALEAFVSEWVAAGEADRQAMERRLDALPPSFVAELMRRESLGGLHG